MAPWLAFSRYALLYYCCDFIPYIFTNFLLHFYLHELKKNRYISLLIYTQINIKLLWFQLILISDILKPLGTSDASLGKVVRNCHALATPSQQFYPLLTSYYWCFWPSPEIHQYKPIGYNSHMNNYGYGGYNQPQAYGGYSDPYGPPKEYNKPSGYSAGPAEGLKIRVC